MKVRRVTTFRVELLDDIAAEAESRHRTSSSTRPRGNKFDKAGIVGRGVLAHHAADTLVGDR